MNASFYDILNIHIVLQFQLYDRCIKSNTCISIHVFLQSYHTFSPIIPIVGQADALASAGVSADCFLFLNVPDEILVDRVVGRRTDPVTGKIYHMTFSPPTDDEVTARLEQRSDDTEEKVKVRLEQFHANVEAVKGSYKDIGVEIDGTLAPEEVAKAVGAAIISKIEA